MPLPFALRHCIQEEGKGERINKLSARTIDSGIKKFESKSFYNTSPLDSR